MSQLLKTIEHHSEDHVINKVEVVEVTPNALVFTYFGRNIEGGIWPEEMQKVISLIKSDTTAHFSDEERAEFHPNGSPKKNGVRYFHHVHHSGDPKTLLTKLDELVRLQFVPNELAKEVKECLS